MSSAGWDGECILAARFGTTVREPSRPNQPGHFPRTPPGRCGRPPFVAGAVPPLLASGAPPLATLAGSASSFAVRAAWALSGWLVLPSQVVQLPMPSSPSPQPSPDTWSSHLSYSVFRLRRQPGWLPVPLGGYGMHSMPSLGAPSTLCVGAGPCILQFRPPPCIASLPPASAHMPPSIAALPPLPPLLPTSCFRPHASLYASTALASLVASWHSLVHSLVPRLASFASLVALPSLVLALLAAAFCGRGPRSPDSAGRSLVGLPGGAPPVRFSHCSATIPTALVPRGLGEVTCYKENGYLLT